MRLRAYCCGMKPDASFVKLQTQLLRLININDITSDRTKIRTRLEKQFMAGWQFVPDRLRMRAKLAKAIRLFRTKDNECVRGLDHCTYYTGANDQRIIVTQPYDASASEIVEDLTLHDGIRPEVIDATEWGFYYPDKAGLFILKFPFGFLKAMQDYEKALRRAEIEKTYEQIEEAVITS